ncbi:MAG: DNA polymerase II [Gammaproteobacteria bacterium]|nr:DNA polymerase II [Gammaproteobacteria bacterium]
MRTRGFILQASYRIHGGAPVVHLYGKLETGETFLVRDHRQTPHFYINADDAEQASALGAVRQFATDKLTFTGTPVVGVSVATPPDAPVVRDRLHTAGLETFEADVRFAVRYLIDRDIKGGCEIVGNGRRGDLPGDLPADLRGTRVTWIFDDPELTPADVSIDPSVLSFDIETDPEAKQLLAIALYGCGLDEVYVVDPSGRAMPEKAYACRDEAAALDAFCRRVSEIDPDVLTGWNVIDFDLSVMARIAKRVKHPFEVGRDAGAMRIRPAQGYFGSGQASIPGRLVLDGMDLVRGAFMRLDDYTLDGVARTILGEGKALQGDVVDRAAEILDRYHNDLEGFAHYARTDARLALEIVEKLNLVPLAVARSKLTGMTPDRVSASIASFDFLYLAALAKKNIVAPSVRSGDSRVSVAQAGGHVLEPVVGIHDNVLVFDFKSLYPSVIRTFNIDPLGYVAEPGDAAAVIKTYSGAAFSRDEATLPRMLDRLFPQREAAKRDGDGVASQAIKILMNSFYGVLGTPACRFHNPAIANAITGQSRHFLLWSKQWFESAGFKVLYGDTDSLFVETGVTTQQGREQGVALAAALTHDIAAYIKQTWEVDSQLELEFEKLYVKLFLPAMRGGSGGARKRYAGLIEGREPGDVEFVGMEVVRRDWTELAKIVQRELYARLFAGEPVDRYLREVVDRVRSGQMDDMLVYRKGLRKKLDTYTANTPPHVVAARKSADPGRVIAYIITQAGPEPLDNMDHQPDREHYVQKQVRPVSEPVLETLGLEFERVVGDDRQLGLF